MNKTPKVSVANVTAWAPKSKLSLALAVLIIVAMVGAGVVRQQKNCPLRLQQGCISLEYATTKAQHQIGLSEHLKLADNHGMLFVFDQPGNPCFWMKDMKFNIDMIWLSSDNKITKIVPNASPDSYPTNYCPEKTSQYVLEMSAGSSARNHLEVGQQINLSHK